MSEKEKFAELCREVGGKEGWQLDGNEILVSIERGRRQKIHFAFFTHEGQAMVRLHTVIGSTRRIRPDRLTFALELNFGLPHGCFAVRDETLVMVETLILAEVDPLELESGVSYLARTGDHYEATLFGSDDN